MKRTAILLAALLPVLSMAQGDASPLLLVMGGKAATTPWYQAGGAPAPVAVYVPKGAASQAASYSNLVSTAHTLIESNLPPTWTANVGWTGQTTADSTKIGLLTDLIPGSNWTVIIAFSNATQQSFQYGCLIGENSTTARCSVWPFASPAFWALSYGNGGYQSAATIMGGVIANAGGNAYLNGTFFGNTGVWTGSATRPLTIFGENGLGYPARADVKSVAIYAATLTSNQQAAVYSAMPK